MPYIPQADRKQFYEVLYTLPEMKTKGELEYCVYYLMKRFMSNKENRYATLHDCVYAVQHCSDEFRRRTLDKREDKAIEENGDI